MTDTNSQRARRPRRLLRRIAIVVGVLVAALILSVVGMTLAFNVERPGDVRAMNEGGAAGKALIVYHPGGSDFQETANTAFAEGLVDAGWEVHITTASSQAPADLSSYDLLVLGSPVYSGAPAKPVKTYLERLGDLAGKPTVAILSAGGNTVEAEVVTRTLIEEANGDIVKLLVLWTFAPNEEMYGISDPAEIMKREASQLPLP